MADDSLITQEQYNADIKRLYDEKIYPYLNGATHVGCVPVGSRLDGWFTTTPKYYLYCDGAEYLKNDYPELAELLAQIDEANSTTQYVGSDANHFKVPDLRGEFIRGTGTNSHSGQGNGANVGIHQDATRLPLAAVDPNGDVLLPNRDSYTYNEDGTVTTTGGGILKRSNTYSGSYSPLRNTRPTNTSLPQYICYKTHYIDLALDSFPLDITQPTDGQLLMWDATAGRWVNGGHKYSTDEHVVGQWIDGKPIYEKTVVLNTRVEVPANVWTNIVSANDISSNMKRMVSVNLLYFNPDEKNTNNPVFVDTTLDLNSGYLKAINGTNHTRYVNIVTVQYTKTTD